MYLHKWGEITVEALKGGLSRQVLHCDSVTIARLRLDRGALVPRHSHPNEQISTIEAGRLRFIFDDREIDAGPGEFVRIPSGVPHAVEALENSVAVDFFAPVREDWRRGDDAYLREPSVQSVTESE
jgi:quercetin dioxygenase-like cupin family protein